jgi:hypothetical protein
MDEIKEKRNARGVECEKWPCLAGCMRHRKNEKRQGISRTSGRNNDLEIGWRARKESPGNQFPDVEFSFGMDVGKQLKSEIGDQEAPLNQELSRYNFFSELFGKFCPF